MTREDLLRLIARAVRRSFTFASESQAMGAADTVLRDLRAVGIRMLRPRRKGTLSAPPPRSPLRSSADELNAGGDPTNTARRDRRQSLPWAALAELGCVACGLLRGTRSGQDKAGGGSEIGRASCRERV